MRLRTCWLQPYTRVGAVVYTVWNGGYDVIADEGAVRAASAPAERVGAVPIGRARDGDSFGNASGSESEGAVPNSALIN